MAELSFEEHLLAVLKSAAIYQNSEELIQKAQDLHDTLGGAFDTACLEVGIAEKHLLKAWSVMLDLPSAKVNDVAEPSGRALLPQRLAVQHQLIGLASQGRRLRVAAHGAPDDERLDEIGFMLSVYLKPEVTTEARIAQGLWSRYGIEPSPRLKVLLEKMGVAPPASLPLNAPPSAQNNPTPPIVDADRRGERVRWSIEDAIAEVALSDSRDEMIDVLVRYSYKSLRSVFVFVRQKDLWCGFDGIDPLTSQEEIKALRLPFGSTQVMARVTDDRAPFLGPIPEGDALQKLLARKPKTTLVVPIIMQGKTIGVVVGDNGERSIAPIIVADLQRLVPCVALALTRLVHKRKERAAQKTKRVKIVAASSGTFDETPARQEPVLPKQSELPTAGSPGKSASTHLLLATAAQWQKHPNSHVDQAFSELANHEGEVDKLNALLSMGPQILPALLRYFPGRFHEAAADVEPQDIAHSPSLLSDAAYIVARLGPDFCAPLLAAALGDEKRERRYAATVLMGSMIVPGALSLLAQRVFDEEESIAMNAALSLESYRQEAEFAEVSSMLVKTVQFGQDTQKRIRAVAALMSLRLVNALPGLISVLGTEPKAVGQAAHAALVFVTKCDFGEATRRWSAWFEEHQHEERWRWLVAGLLHQNQTIREESHDELVELCGYHFDFDPRATRRTREKTALQYKAFFETSS